MSTSRIISYTHAENLCTGSLGDANYSTCILNNLRFLPYSVDTAEALNLTNSGLVSNVTLPYLDGKTFVTGKPIAMSDTAVRMLQKNDYGQVSFRCLDVSAKPMLPLMNLVDLGLEDRPLVILSSINLPTSDTTEDLCANDLGYISGIPVKCPSDCTTTDCLYEVYLYNLKNYLIHLNNQYQTILTGCDTITNLISSNGNYNNLLDLAQKATNSMANLLAVYDIVISISDSLNTLDSSTDYYKYIKQLIISINATTPSKNTLNIEVDKLNTNIIQVINNYVTIDEDWVHFQHYADLDIAATYMKTYRTTNAYIEIQNKFDISLKFLNCFSYVPVVNSTTVDSFNSLTKEVATNFIFERYNLSSIILTKIHELYTQSSGPQVAALLKQKELIYRIYDLSKSFWQGLTKNTTTDTALQALIDKAIEAEVLFESVLTFIDKLVIPISNADLDTFYKTTILGLGTASINEVNLGGSFKDSGRYYFANIAYVLGFGKLTHIHSIKINNALYTTSSITDSKGNSVTGISDSGCTRYKLKFKMFPDESNNSNLKELEMYIYPGTPNQPYCPTINKYHNYNAAKYSGLFTKLIKDTDIESPKMGLYMFKGYRPLQNTVEQIISFGSTDINSIDLTLPNLDKDSPETFIKKEVVSLTNSASLISNGIITSKDLKYYLKASLLGTVQPIETNNKTTIQGLSVPEANNYPNLSIVEFIDFPLGTSFKAPKIEFLIEAEDMVEL